MTLAARLGRLGTATLGEAWPAARLVKVRLGPIAHDMVAAGPALPVRCRPGDNLALHRAIAGAEPGTVLVVDYGGSLESGPFGEIMALACQMRGIVGLVIDGAVRDSQAIAALGFPVFCRGLDIRGTTKQDRGVIGEPVTLCGAEIGPGDMIVADADAVLVLSAEDAPAAALAGEARVAKEAAIMDRIRGGQTTLDILGLRGIGER